MYPAVCLPFSVPSTEYCVTVSAPGLHRVCTLDTWVKGRQLENMADYIYMSGVYIRRTQGVKSSIFLQTKVCFVGSTND